MLQYYTIIQCMRCVLFPKLQYNNKANELKPPAYLFQSTQHASSLGRCPIPGRTHHLHGPRLPQQHHRAHQTSRGPLLRRSPRRPRNVTMHLQIRPRPPRRTITIPIPSAKPRSSPYRPAPVHETSSPLEPPKNPIAAPTYYTNAPNLYPNPNAKFE